MGNRASFPPTPEKEDLAEESLPYDLDPKPNITGDNIFSNFLLRNCVKADNHSKFHSMENLHLDHLPDAIKTDQMLQFVNDAGILVVRLCISYLSHHRHGKFALPSSHGRGFKRFATGWACRPFDTNADSIKIITARHAIYDNLEATKTEVTFFYDGPNHSQETVLYGKKLEIIEIDRDFAILECGVSDESVRQKLNEALNKLNNCNINLPLTNLSENGNDVQNNNEHANFIVIIISHPHGGSKHVTFGSCKDVEETDLEFDMTTGEKSRAMFTYTYDTMTCPGSSGAPVIVVGKPGIAYFWTPHLFVNSDGYGVSAKGLVVWRNDVNPDDR